MGIQQTSEARFEEAANLVFADEDKDVATRENDRSKEA
ncbi:hypothetical protein JCM19237_6491 [Photobacterium aphoticum]|uniref:Uncharacterized protein n=1 Tax=Photobacterium aphoticum TaxID=754436 RepID=A0A090R7K0_9GAMM|nr:hypothetical protein JCM19237_6491 [Photobacterium aphoticum]